MTPTFASFAQNNEDVVLWRALGGVRAGRYIDIGANHPTEFSISWPFYQLGWRGITVEPVAAFAAMHRQVRPEDLMVEAAISATPNRSVILHEIPDTGLSTLVDHIRDVHEQAGWKANEVPVEARSLNDVLTDAGWDGADIHFMTVDTEGAELDVLRSIDLRSWRPWVLVIESTAPLTTTATHDRWEDLVLGAGYQFCMFDGLSRFYVTREHAELAPQLRYPACPLDDFTTLRQRQSDAEIARLRASLQDLTDDVGRWRAAALGRWTETLAGSVQPDVPAPAAPEIEELARLRRELTAIRGTVSWKVTRPLRAVRQRLPSERSREEPGDQ